MKSSSLERVLITGGAGFIGSYTADLLLEKGYKIRILDNLSSRTHFGKWPDYLDPRIEKIRGDVRLEKDVLKALDDVDYVIHLAALMDILPQFSEFVDTNIKSTALIYELIVKYKFPIKKIIIASSQFVYGEGRWHCPKDGEVFPKPRILSSLEKGKWDPSCPICQGKIDPLFNLETHQDPPNQYAISKYSQELFGIRLGRLYNIPTVVLRYSIVHGPRQSFKNPYSGALRIFVMKMLLGEQPPIYEDGYSLRDYVSVYDVAKANLIVLKDRGANFEVFNVGGGKAYTVLELSEIIAKILGKRIKPKISGEFRLGDIRHAVSDISKLKKLGWEPSVSEEETVAKYVTWIKGQKVAKNLTNLSEDYLRSVGTLRKINK